MTILEMLDHLEAEIIHLRSRNRELEQLALATSRQATPRPNKKTAAPAKGAKKSTARKEAATAKPTTKEKAPAPPELEKPVTGKRQALGRSLLQLRRAPSKAAGDE